MKNNIELLAAFLKWYYENDECPDLVTYEAAAERFMCRLPQTSGSVSAPAVRVRFHPKDVDETFDGTLIEETKHAYLVIPDDDLNSLARWNKKCCEVLP